MKAIKNKQKQGVSGRQKQKLSLKMILVAGSIVFGSLAIPLLLTNLMSSFKSTAKSKGDIEVVNISDQVFTNEKSIDQPVLNSQKKSGENVIQIREKKAINAH